MDDKFKQHQSRRRVQWQINNEIDRLKPMARAGSKDAQKRIAILLAELMGEFDEKGDCHH